MKVLSAAFNVVHDGEDGSAGVAQLLGKNRGTIDHEVNPPRSSSAKLGLIDALKITKWRRDYRILYAFAEECDHLCIPAPTSAGDLDASTESILSKASKLSMEIARSFEQMNGSLSDGQVSAGELAGFEAEALDVIAAIAEVVRAMRSKMEGDLTRHHAAVEAARRGAK